MMSRKESSAWAKSRILLAAPIIVLLLLCFGCQVNSQVPDKSVDVFVQMDDGKSFTVQVDLDEIGSKSDTILVKMDGDTTNSTYKVQVEVVDANKDEEVFVIVDAVPEYPGGDEARIKFLRENVHYPKEAKEKGIQGMVFVSFIVEKDGSISNVKIVRGVDKLLDDESVRVTKLMPKWIPGRQKGEVVRVSFNMPIRFTIPPADKE
jgi:TonB family protein